MLFAECKVISIHSGRIIVSTVVPSDMDTSKYSGKEDFEWAVRINRISLTLIGLWPNPKENTKEKLMSNIRVLCTFSIIISLLIPTIHSLIKVHSNIMLTLDNMQCTLPLLIFIIKLLIFWWKKEALASSIKMIVEDWLKIRNIYERNTMIKWALRARILITFSYLMIVTAFLFLFGMPLFGKSVRVVSNITDSSNNLAIQSYYIYDVTKRPLYELTFINQCISFIIGAIIHIGIDNFLSLTVFHICGQLDIMRNRLKHGTENFHAMLRSNIKHHIRLLRAIDTIEDTYNVILLIVLLYFAIIFAFCGFLLVIIFEDGRNNISLLRLIFIFNLILSVFVHMAMHCAVGEVLTAKCNGIHYAVYDCEWYSLDPFEAKNLILFMIKSGKSVYFTAGQMIPITMATFCNLLKTSAGYISILLTTRKA